MKKILVLLVTTFVYINVYSYDFYLNGIYYTKTSDTTVSVASGTGGWFSAVDYYYYNDTVYIPESIIYDSVSYNVTAIGMFAFYNSPKLYKVIIGNNVETIDYNAFDGCKNLKSITFGSNYTDCGTYDYIKIPRFYECNNIEIIEVVEDNLLFSSFEGILYNKEKTEILYIPKKIKGDIHIPYGVKSLGDFSNCVNLTSIDIPNTVTTFGLFSGCISLTSITIPSSITTIGNGALKDCKSLKTITYNADSCGGEGFRMQTYYFYGSYFYSWIEGCDSLETITIGNNVKFIPQYFISNKKSIKNLTIGDSIERIGDYAFFNVSFDNVKNVNLNMTKHIGKSAFKNCNLILSVTTSAEYIEDSAFADCTKLVSLTLNDSTRIIKRNAFRNCIKLKDVSLGKNIDSIKDGVFENCMQLKKIILPDLLKYIGDKVFKGCVLIGDTITIPSKVNYIGSLCFDSCSSITALYMKCTIPPTIFSNTFNTISKTIPVYIPCGSEVNYYLANYWDEFSNVLQVSPYIIDFGDDSIKGTANIIQQPKCNQVIIEATPKYGYHFVSWSDDNTDNPRNLFVDKDTLLQAVFDYNTYNITANTNDNTMGNITGAGDYYYLTNVTLTAVPNENYHFVSWSDGVKNNPRQITLTKDTVITAIFEIDTHFVVLAVNNTELGEVFGGGVYDYNAQTTLSATAVKGYHFSKWNDGNTDNPRSIVVTQDTSFTAYFEIDTFFVSVLSNDNLAGTTDGSGIYDYNSEAVISASANKHYHFVSWSDGNTSNPRIVTIDKDSVFTALFEEDNKYHIQVISSNNTMGTTEGEGVYYEGEQVQIKAVANKHYIFKEWSDGNTSNPRTITVLSDNVYIANFAKAVYTVKVESADLNKGTVQGGGIYEYGDIAVIKAIANKGYKFTQWNDGNTEETRQFSVENNVTYIANFEKESSLQGANELPQIQIYPNPAKDVIIIENVVCSTDYITINIYDNKGGLVLTETKTNATSYTLNTTLLKSCVYYLRLVGVENSRVFKLIKE